MRRLGLGLAAAAVAGGCAQTPPPRQLSCNFQRYLVEAGDPARRATAAVSDAAASTAAPTGGGYATRDFDTLIGDARDARAAGPQTAPGASGTGAAAPLTMLFMSGGGQKGAFGAGFLDGWRAARGGALPAFDVVTGVSTGAILATFAFTGDTAGAVAGYSIDRESDLVTAFPGGLTAIVGKGSRADLVPLRSRLDAALTPAMLGAVADAAVATPPRLLLAGAVDVDSGDAVALDLTDMARRWAATGADQKAALKACYIEAIIASSSAPPAAPPVFIDNVMYIDGGARFGMFSEQLGRLLPARPAGDGPSLAPPRPGTFLIVNGTLRIPAECGKTGQASDGDGGCAPPAAWDAPHKPWNILSLGLRSVDVLQNQVYRFSAQSIETQAQGKAFAWVKIEDAADDFPFTWPAATGRPGELVDSGTRTCGEWSKRDQAIDQPLQFHPRYMRCLIAYGRDQGRLRAW